MLFVRNILNPFYQDMAEIKNPKVTQTQMFTVKARGKSLNSDYNFFNILITPTNASKHS